MSFHKQGIRIDLTIGNIPETLRMLFLPMLIGISSIIAVNIFDTFYIAKLGTKHLAAISFTFPVSMILTSLSLGLGIGTSSVVSRACGEKDFDKIKRLATDSLFLSILLVLGLVIIGISTIDPLFRLLGADETIMPLIRSYMLIWYPGMIFVVVPMVGNSIIRALGNMKTPAMIMVFSAIINIVLDPLLIFGFKSIPGLGMDGAAYASLIARFLSFLAFFVVLQKENIILYTLPPFEKIWQSWREVIIISLPVAFTNLLSPLADAIVTPFIAPFGHELIAANGIVNRVNALLLLPIMALVSVIGPFVGQNFGAKKLDRIHKSYNYSTHSMWIWSLVILFAIFLGGNTIAAIFDKNPKTIHYATIGLYYLPPIVATVGISSMIGSIFNATGRPLLAALLMSFRTIICFIPLSYLFSRYGFIYATFLSSAIASILSYLLALYIYRRFSFRKIIDIKQD